MFTGCGKKADTEPVVSEAVEAILSGSNTLEVDLFAMANELKQYTEQEQKKLAV